MGYAARLETLLTLEHGCRGSQRVVEVVYVVIAQHTRNTLDF